MSIFKLSNLLLSKIILSIDDNGDIICLLLTCKRLYSQNNSSVRRSIQFKGIKPIKDNGQQSLRFRVTFNQFKLLSFNDILENSVSDQYVILPDVYYLSEYPKCIQDRISANRDNIKGISTALVNHDRSIVSAKKLCDKTWATLYKMSSIETLFINHQDVLDLGSISLLPNLQRLSMNATKLNLGPHPFLKYLTLDIATLCPLGDLGLDKFVSLTDLSFKNYFVTDVSGLLLPSNLTSLTLRLQEIPPPNAFLSLTSLVKLKIYLRWQPTIEQRCCIDLQSLCNLRSFMFCEVSNPTEYNENFPEIIVSPSIKILHLSSDYVQIPSQCRLPLLEKLNVNHRLLADEKVSTILLSSPKIKELVISSHCLEPIQANIIPPTIEKLTILKYTKRIILDQVVLPPSLTDLTILGPYEPIKLPKSLIKLRQELQQTFDQDALVSLSQHVDLKELVLISEKDKIVVLPSPYPPNLETLNLVEIFGDHTIQVPLTIKYLSIRLKRTPNTFIYSISSRITDPIISQQWLPMNTTHLTCTFTHHLRISFRLDQVINHTSVTNLYLIPSDQYITFHFTIQRLDSDNKNVLSTTTTI
ncbi:hypothetical protein DFA_02459 [Cavenderia fasciculata]|uniref:Uncharacterized protein n=1 Tax=Cavenderia fasciculata TaxID=261658 RepID=F4PZI2_CACFS|nr:uncharacterized protein DFA_02459 [Cavenderia fasciculata]EGG19211.1 hypothetical protein DFA_02459 [Cavenderia fasciculata]|eukprot:XP_004366844.1 hypothetical protein DFA_02459 [Cavenderia fasciculata]